MANYTVEKTVESFLIYEVLEYAPASIPQIIERVGFIPRLNRKLKRDATMRILFTLEELGYVVRTNTKKWAKTSKSVD